ncbi:MAG TPA: glutamate racemase [Candidatus Omnitrophica bacterium]|nr:glutamate racemase [Candidatus Omnitrophota bacterium]HCI45591.1 glutamate racemase [Candidatus Omnitrophota bacterium]
MYLNNNPIGVFDSGLGGLTVVKELIRLLPREHIVYYGDTARVPYGTKSREAIIRFSHENMRVLLKRNVKMVVVACNTSSSYALGILRKHFHLPIVGVIDPGARKAAEVTRNKKIGVIATPATVNSRSYARAIARRDRAIKISSQACPLFVPLVEEGWLRKPVTTAVAREYLGPLRRSGIDTLVLGCTHYPLLKSVLKDVMGAKVALVDSAHEVAAEVKRVLHERRLLRTSGGRARRAFLISDRPQQFEKTAREFLGYNIKAVKI